MKIELEIPNEFEEHFKQDKFKDSLERIMADIKYSLENGDCLCAGRYEYETIEMLEKALEDSKSAYDIDNVVKQLEQSKHEICLSDDDLEHYQNGIDEAIEIVKHGGISDDVCEWEKGSSGYVGYPAYYSKCCTTNSNGLEMQTHIIADWKYCPYCGKKIKVVE